MLRSRSLWVGSFVVAAAVAAPAVRRSADDTAALWKKKCANCHGEDGKGATKMGKKMQVEDMTTADNKKKYDDAAMKKTIAEGVNTEVNGVKKKMEAYKDLKPEQVDAIVAMIRSWQPKE